MKKGVGCFAVVCFLLVGACTIKNAAAADLRTMREGGAERLLSLLDRGQKAYDSVEGYEALFVKRETEKGVFGPRETIYFKFKKPFKLFMKWLNTGKKGLQVLYERGRHDGKLVIHKPGFFFGLAPVIFLPQDSPWVREGSASYDIEDAGIGTFLADFGKAARAGLAERKLAVRWTGARSAEVTFPGTRSDEVYFAYRVRVWFHRATPLPVRMELFDWDRRPIGIYEYRGLKLNERSEKSFERHIHRSLLRVYRETEKESREDEAVLS